MRHFVLLFSLSLLISACNSLPVEEKSEVNISNLRPEEFRERLAQAPIAYLPLGTIEWHGEHLPLGADGLQPSGIFELLANEVGGMVYPMLFLGPDLFFEEDGVEYYGMDIKNYEDDERKQYTKRQFDGSSYWLSDSLYLQILDACVKQISRAGFKILLAHGHGPSTAMLSKNRKMLEEKYAIKIHHLFDFSTESGLGFMADHAAMTETSITWALHPEMVRMEALPEEGWPLGVGGKDPRQYASKEIGEEIIRDHFVLWSKLLNEELDNLDK